MAGREGDHREGPRRVDMVDWVEKAVQCVKAVEARCPKDVQSAFRTRARQMPSLLYYAGAAYALAVLAARGDASKMFSPAPLEDAVGQICAGDGGREEKSYSLYGLCLVSALREVGVAAAAIEDAVRALSRSRTAEIRIAPFADWLKKLAEAKFEPER